MQIRKATVDKIEDDKHGKSIAYLKPDNPAREDPVRALDPRVIVEMDPIFDEANEMLHPTYERLKVRPTGPLHPPDAATIERSICFRRGGGSSI